MHILFVHQNFPAQFDHIAQHLVKQHGFRCTFASEKHVGEIGGVEGIQYQCAGGATSQTNIYSRPFENQVSAVKAPRTFSRSWNRIGSNVIE